MNKHLIMPKSILEKSNEILIKLLNEDLFRLKKSLT